VPTTTTPARCGRHHDLTGPESFTFEGLAGVLTGIAGIPVSYTDVPARVSGEVLRLTGRAPSSVAEVLRPAA
jgi:NAD(P)H dehydrogenase (quinone)